MQSYAIYILNVSAFLRGIIFFNGGIDMVGKVLRRCFWLIPERIKRRYVIPKFTILRCVFFTDLDISSDHSDRYFTKTKVDTYFL